MKVAIITDTHYGARKGSKVFHDYFELFYKNIFFPTLEKYKINTIIHMGDAFDSRKSIEYISLEWSKEVVFDPLSKYDVHMIVGNHDTYFKNTSKVNSPDLLLKHYPNVKTYSNPQEVTIGGLDILFLPWINENNQDISLSLIKNTKCSCAMGHLEINGFRVNPQIVMDHGIESTPFKKFSKVFSGHYHTRSDDGRIFYLGNPYEMFWSDVDDTRGFTIFDTETLEHFHINNPYKLFHVLEYDDKNEKDSFKYLHFDSSEYENKFIKVIVKNKTKPKQYEKFLDKIYQSNAHEVKITELFTSEEMFVEDEIDLENTVSILDKHIEETDIDLNKNEIKRIVRKIYKEAFEIS